LIGAWEGNENHAYLDRIASPPIWTICSGHTKGVEQGDYMSDGQCTDLLRIEVLEYREGLHSYFTTTTKLQRLTPERDGAYVSLAYNVGVRGAGRSTATRRLNAGDIAGGCQALTWWNKAGGRVVRGLVRRRADEYRLCMIGLG
jgi:lysozyme